MPNEELTVEDPEIESNKDDNKEKEVTDDLDVLNKEDEDDEEEDEEESDEEEDEEDEKKYELSRVEYKALKKDFPELFKKYPELREAFFREQKFTEIFPTVEQAQEALEASEQFDEIRKTVTDGNTEKFLEQLNEASSKGFKKFSENFLPSLQKTNKDLYVEITSPIVKNLLNQVFAHGKSESNDNIKNAARLVHKVIFGGDYTDVEHGIINVDKKTVKKDEDDEEFNKEKNNFYAGKYRELYSSVASTFVDGLDKEIERELDPTKSIKSSFMKKKMIEEIREKVQSAMESDSSHMSRMNSLWKREERNGFSGTLKNSLITTLLTRAKILVPKYRAEVRKEVLGVQKKRDEDNQEKIDNRRDKMSPGNETRRKGVVTVKEAREKGMTDRAILDM